jgi:hypothetical protein
MLTFTLERNVDILSHVTRAHLEEFGLFDRGVDEMSQWSNSGSNDGLTATHGSVGHMLIKIYLQREKSSNVLHAILTKPTYCACTVQQVA